jgi:uncharacterized membrane protein (UPF0136 family)
MPYGVGTVVIGGGTYAFLKSRSTPSLLGSLLIGGTLIGGGYLIDKGKRFSGHAVSAMAGFGLTLIGVISYRVSKKRMPRVPMVIIGLVCGTDQVQKALLYTD